MRKILLIISLVAIAYMSSFAQSNNARLGIKLGPTIDWASSGSIYARNDGIKIGINFGLVYDHFLSNHIAVSSGVNLNLLQMKYTFTDYRFVDDFLEKTNVLVERRLKATNVEIPLKLKLKFDVVDAFKAYVEAGGGLSFNCKDRGKDNYDLYWASSSDDDYIDCSNQYRLMQVSMIFGLGTEYEISGNFSAFAQLTFDHGFSNAFVNALEKQTGSILRNNFIGVEVGFLF